MQVFNINFEENLKLKTLKINCIIEIRPFVKKYYKFLYLTKKQLTTPKKNSKMCSVGKLKSCVFII